LRGYRIGLLHVATDLQLDGYLPCAEELSPWPVVLGPVAELHRADANQRADVVPGRPFDPR